jgi:Na+-transporting methylmalonyl-CoA/oxaloacetate decarboxylase gamma subunit
MENTPNNPQTEMGPMMGIILIVLMLLIGAWYFLWQKVTKLEDQREQAKMATTTATTTEYINLGTTTEK